MDVKNIIETENRKEGRPKLRELNNTDDFKSPY
jgi:hypothetical protein